MSQVAADDRPMPAAAPRTSAGRCWTTPRPSRSSQSAIRAPGSADSCVRAKDATMSLGSWRSPSLQSRHIEDKAGGRSAEDVIRLPLFLRFGEALRLQIEHRAVATIARHQLVVRTELDNA